MCIFLYEHLKRFIQKDYNIFAHKRISGIEHFFQTGSDGFLLYMCNSRKTNV